MESRIPQQAGTSFLIGVTPVVLIKHLINTCLQSTLGLRTPRYFGHPLQGHQGSTSPTETTPYIPRVDCNTTLLGGGETESGKRSLHTNTIQWFRPKLEPHLPIPLSSSHPAWKGARYIFGLVKFLDPVTLNTHQTFSFDTTSVEFENATTTSHYTWINLFLKKPLAGKLYTYHDVSGIKDLRFQNVYCPN